MEFVEGICAWCVCAKLPLVLAVCDTQNILLFFIRWYSSLLMLVALVVTVFVWVVGSCAVSDWCMSERLNHIKNGQC